MSKGRFAIQRHAAHLWPDLDDQSADPAVFYQEVGPVSDDNKGNIEPLAGSDRAQDLLSAAGAQHGVCLAADAKGRVLRHRDPELQVQILQFADEITQQNQYPPPS